MTRRTAKPKKEIIGTVESHFLDSGAFTLKTQAIQWAKKTGRSKWDFYDTKEFWTYIDDYARFVKKYRIAIDYYANVDVIPNPDLTWRNQKYLEEKFDLNPVPIVHYTTSLKWLEKYIDLGYKFIGIGGLVGNMMQDGCRDWLDEAFDLICDSPNRLPRVRMHGFGVTGFELMLRFPWWCMTDEHEVLTREGWKGREEIKVGDMVLAFSDGISRWEIVQEVSKFPVVNAPIVEMDYRTFSCRVTENHRWRTVDYNGHWSWQTTDSIRGNTWIPRIGKYKGPINKTYPDWFVELAAWFWTEGSIKNRKRCKKPSINIYQSQSANPEKVERIRQALLASGEKFCEGVDRRPNKTGGKSAVICFELYGHVRDKLLAVMPDKTILMEFVTSLTRKQLRRFVKVSIMADGCKKLSLADERMLRTPWVRKARREFRKGGDGFSITQKDGKNLDVFRIACLLAGYPTSKWKTVGGSAVSSSSVHHIYPRNIRNRTTVSYTGELWCIRVPSGAFFTKCNEKIYVTGNSVDSSAWTKIGAFGGILVPHKRGGKFIFSEQPYIVKMSEDSPDSKILGKHYQTMKAAEKKIVQEWLEQIGVTLGSEKVHGVLNRHIERRAACLLFFEEMRKHLPKYPWPFHRAFKKHPIFS